MTADPTLLSLGEPWTWRAWPEKVREAGVPRVLVRDGLQVAAIARQSSRGGPGRTAHGSGATIAPFFSLKDVPRVPAAARPAEPTPNPRGGLPAPSEQTRHTVRPNLAERARVIVAFGGPCGSQIVRAPGNLPGALHISREASGSVVPAPPAVQRRRAMLRSGAPLQLHAIRTARRLPARNLGRSLEGSPRAQLVTLIRQNGDESKALRPETRCLALHAP